MTMRFLPPRARRSLAPGFTIIELMVVIAVVAVLLVLAVPSLQEMILMQRLRGTNAQLVTDLQFARSEAVSRGQMSRVNFGADGNQTCYVIYNATDSAIPRCDCTLGTGSACTDANTKEIRTVSVPRSSGVSLQLPAGQDPFFGFDHVTGGLLAMPSDLSEPMPIAVEVDVRVDDDRRLRTKISQTGRPSVCAPNAARMGVTGC